MKVVILAGGLGTRLSEETHLKPKPMVEIGYRPILWHIMKIYSKFGFNDFIICGGYKVNLIKEFFNNYLLYTHDVHFDYSVGKTTYSNPEFENWKVSVIDTGLNTNTAGRLKRVASLLKDEENFFFTYGDGLADIDINQLNDFHKKNNLIATVTAVVPPGRYGALSINDKIVEDFEEKPKGDSEGRINGGFFVLNKNIFNYIENDESSFEFDVLPNLSKEKQLQAFMHNSFWRPMDTLRDTHYLNKLWDSGNAPWI